LFVAHLTLLRIPASAQGKGVEADNSEPPKATYGFETDFNSRYVFRGFAYSQGAVNQSTAWVTISGFTFYTWGNFMLNRERQQRELSEIDFGASYKREWKKLTVEPAFGFGVYSGLRISVGADLCVCPGGCV